tara:strand:+ start:977 stop:1174 length:198 start_codon:yes stop_codon:yes gene_type:complete
MNFKKVYKQPILDDEGNFISSDEENIVAIEPDGSKLFIPVNMENRHYAEIMRQVDAGELTIEEAE